MTNTVPRDAKDSLGELIQRIYDKLLAAARVNLKGGGALEGDRWTLTSAALTSATTEAEPNEFRFEEMTSVGVVDDELRVWIRGQDEPAAAVPLKSVNARILLQILQDRLRGREQKSPEPSEGLGRVIIERRAGRWTPTVLFTLGALAGIGCIGFFIAGPRTLLGFGIGFGLLAFAVACNLGGYHARIAFFRCHEWGVNSRGLFADKSLRYRDVASFTYQEVVWYHNGAYSGTHYTLLFALRFLGKTGGRFAFTLN